MISPHAYIHPQAIVEDGATVGAGSRVWAFSHVLPGATLGEDCNVCDHTFIENDVQIGDRVTIKSGVYLWDGLRIESDVFIGPAAVFTNDKKPRSKVYPSAFSETHLHEGCSIGANATILPGLQIGSWAIVAAGSVVTKDVKSHSLVVGSPARHVGWVCHCAERVDSFGKEWRCASCGRKYIESDSGLLEA